MNFKKIALLLALPLTLSLVACGEKEKKEGEEAAKTETTAPAAEEPKAGEPAKEEAMTKAPEEHQEATATASEGEKKAAE